MIAYGVFARKKLSCQSTHVYKITRRFENILHLNLHWQKTKKKQGSKNPHWLVVKLLKSPARTSIMQNV